MLPDDNLFCPNLSCQVFDQILKGLHQPLLGTFSIGIGDLIKKEEERRVKKIKEIDNICFEITNMMI